MGTDRKSKEKTKSKERHYSSASEDERKSKRHRATEEKERKSRKSDKKERKDKKSHRHRSDKEKKHKSKHAKDSRHSKHEFAELSTDDYFSKNNEFATWLKDEKSLFFSDLSSESARELFSDFVKVWNNGKLDSRYYDGITTGPRTAHNWKIKQ